ncbi:uncharacterized protein LOC110467072 [Mizuhopecten yessoensis]|uniref:Zinc finger ZZ-type and EF-hand domain-containing protein 1 n=1 Tax=Mizuhopecten yessoensis TaxID=6573 RepID=A0A210PMP7_MIZYE|nr:uncharacterized protein LOC110467072 [Mizuhopecten yessoensis]XP_021379644.1 uncharacterized protein LOC110467072 [Mizuhopecten yessoensis]XP_021379645.1 uncharacterized protein LOC110467072 [Mizuhopecten yessoensis]XP_021379646.1 uncharacterized protein LOC110467072 [Mizuhopecten yessoensis]XP_021379647.1 uncharacterized protein LOC110467072 [Mizuhopecten yessoensis]OWF37762.1 Zinc finger ZZ-type and EF-hand domain-containing protein 1 [Mizuhopecten yessoensis]
MASQQNVFAAAGEGNLPEVKRLVEAGSSLEQGDKDGLTPLMIAIKNGHREVSEFLVGEMSSQSLSVVTTSDKWNALHWMAAFGRPWLDIWKTIQRKCPDLWDQTDGNQKRPIDKSREHRDRSQRHRQLYQELEGALQDEYIKGISKKVEKKCNLTITFTGHEGVGKTCLVEQLRNNVIPPEGPASTNTANIHVKYMLFDPETFEKETIEEGSELEVGNQRIKRVLTSPGEVSENRNETDSGTRIADRSTTGVPLPSTHHNMQLLEMSLTPEQENEVDEYEQFMKWLNDCNSKGVDQWEESMNTEHPSREQQRLVQKFLTIFSRRLDRRNYCTCCSSECCGNLWYRCQQCVNTNICKTCYGRSIQPEKEHDSSHTMIFTGHTGHKYKCRGCECSCLDTLFKCKTCKDVYVCLGCYTKDRFNHPPTHELEKIVRVKYAARITSDDQHEATKAVLETVVQTDTKTKGLVTIYDFGGEKIFYNTHHCILTNDMIFILVFDVSICLDQNEERKEAGYDRIEFWLRSIATSAIDEALKKRGTPPIILIGSHMDLVPGSEDEKEDIFRGILTRLSSNPEIKTVIQKHVKDMFYVSNLNDSSKNRELYDKIWRAIIDAAECQSQWLKEIPARWLALEQELVKKKIAGYKVLEFKDLKLLNKTLAVPLQDAEEINTFVRYLKTTGYFLCFGLDEWEESLESKKTRGRENSCFIILDPQWIISAFKCIITSPKYKTNLSIKEKEEWQAYEESGELPVGFMQSLMKKETGQQFIEKFKFICIVMETLGLISSPLLDTNEELEEYIVPCMMKEAVPSRIQTILDKPFTIKTPVLCIKFDNDFIPQAIWDKTIAKCLHRFRPMTEPGYEQSELIQRGFVCLSENNLWKVVLNCHKNAMKVLLFARSGSRIPSGKGVEFRKFLDFWLPRVLEMNHQGHFRYNYYLHNDYQFSKNEIMVKAEDLAELDQLPCQGGNGESFLSQKDYGIWFEDNTQVQCSVGAVDALSVHVPDRSPSPKEMARISKFIGKDYQSFFMQLKCPIASVERFFHDYQGFSCRVPITKILVDMINSRPNIGFPQIAFAMKEEDIDVKQLQTVLDSNRNYQYTDMDFPETLLQRALSVNNVSILIDYISPKVSFILFLELNLKVNTIETEEVSVRDVREQITTLIKRWIKDEGRAATVHKLLLAMKECDMNIYDLVKSLQENI